jgi:zinc transporter ZupT
MADLDESAFGQESGETLPLRIGSVFVIMVVSALGCMFPLLVLDLDGRAKFGGNLPLTPSSRNKTDGERVFHGAHAMHLLKSFSAGIILCVGFVHVLAEANETLEELVDFPLAFFVAMMGSIVVLALSQVVDGVVSSMGRKSRPPGPSSTGGVDMVSMGRDPSLNMSKVVISAPDTSPSARAPSIHLEEAAAQEGLTASQKQFLQAARQGADGASGNEHQHAPITPVGAALTGRKKPTNLQIVPPPPPSMRSPGVAPAGEAPSSPFAQLPFVSPRAQASLKTMLSARSLAVQKQPSFGSDGHNHSFHEGGGHNDAVHVVQAFKNHSLVIAYIMEVGIVFHSVLIGIGLGTATSSINNTRTLLVAISVHQFFEGAGLSTCILEARLPRMKNAIMFGLFSITTSLGIVIGIGISKMYDEESREAALVEGIFNAFAAGILIYLALVDILQEEFSRREVRQHKIWQIQMMMCVLLGAGAMSVIAIWA